MSFEPAVLASALGKSYSLYGRPSDRLVQMLHGFVGRLAGVQTRPRYREFHALSGVSMRIERGETLGIIGRNGSGKSTLLQLLCGTLSPTQGSVQVHGRVAALLELGSGFHPEFSGRENVFLNATVLGLSREQIMERFDAIAAFADIGDFMDRPLKSYSSGMAMRLAFSVIAHVDADVLVIDEALSVGDAFFTQKCMRFLRGFMKTGTVIFVSHDIEAVMALCSRVIWLDGGQVRRDGPTKAVCQDYLDALLSQDGNSSAPSTEKDAKSHRLEDHRLPRDSRQKEWEARSMRNEISVFAFDPGATGVGHGGCRICAVTMSALDGDVLNRIAGGETVRLDVEVMCHTMLRSPIVGFMVKDRTGQALFGDNTWLSFADQPVEGNAGERLLATFVFDMPRLPCGDYTMVVAVADGTQEENTMHAWLHDALYFRSEASSVASGLIGIPMRQILLAKERRGDAGSA